MFILYAGKTRLAVRQREPVTSGSVNVYEARFEFSPDWEGLERTAVFKAGTESRSVPLDGDGRCVIPWEVLAVHGRQLEAGVYGTEDGGTVLPTVWAGLGTILQGAAPGEDAQPPTPELWRQELAGKGDALGYTDGGELGLYAGDKLLSAVPVSGGGSGTQGPPGADGLSAYQIAVNHGFEGTEDEWLASLTGPAGADGKDGQDGAPGKDGAPGQDGAPGEDGPPGADGKSAYEVALDNGFSGTEVEWLASLKGEAGPQGPQGPPGPGGAADIAVDDTLKLSEDGVLSVSLPTKSITKAEYDALSDKEKQAEKVYLITDAEESSAVPSGNGEIVYSTEEKVVGTWIDGKPVYQVTIEGTTLSNRSTLPLVKDANMLVDAHGMISYGAAYNSFPPGIYYGLENNIATIRGLAMLRFYDNTIYLVCEAVSSTNAAFQKQPFTLTLQYTKASDYESTAEEGETE